MEQRGASFIGGKEALSSPVARVKLTLDDVVSHRQFETLRRLYALDSLRSSTIRQPRASPDSKPQLQIELFPTFPYE